MSYFKEAEQIHNSQNLSEFCRLKQTKVNCVKSLAPATLVVESSYPYHCLQFTVDPRFFITLVYYVLDHLCLLWKIAVCYFLLVIQNLLFWKILEFFLIILTKNKHKINYFQKQQALDDILLVIFKNSRFQTIRAFFPRIHPCSTIFPFLDYYMTQQLGHSRNSFFMKHHLNSFLCTRDVPIFHSIFANGPFLL